MISQLLNILQFLSDMLYRFIMTIPLGLVRWIFIGLFLLLALWVFLMPAQRNGHKTHVDLRWFAIGILLLQSIIYIVL